MLLKLQHALNSKHLSFTSVLSCRLAATLPDTTYYSVKRFMGQQLADTQGLASLVRTNHTCCLPIARLLQAHDSCVISCFWTATLVYGAELLSTTLLMICLTSWPSLVQNMCVQALPS